MIKPGLTFVPSAADTHQDHRAVSKALTTATRASRNVLYYEAPTNTEFTPTIFQDIEDVLDDKIALLNMHASQADRTNIAGLSIMGYAKAASTFRGFQHRCRYAEGFMPLRMSLEVITE